MASVSMTMAAAMIGKDDIYKEDGSYHEEKTGPGHNGQKEQAECFYSYLMFTI